MQCQCAGNRRTAMSETQKVRGVGWGLAALGNGECWSVNRDITQSVVVYPHFHPFSGSWTGVRLSDVLHATGIPLHATVSTSGGKHVEFISVDKCKVGWNCVHAQSSLFVFSMTYFSGLNIMLEIW